MKKLVQKCSIPLLIVIGVTFCLGSPNPQPSPDDGEALSNADLHHLLSLLDESEPEVTISNDQPVNPAILLEDLAVNTNELNGVSASSNHEVTATPFETTTEVIKIVPDYPAKMLIKRPRSTTTTTTTTEATTTTSTSTTETPKPVSTTATTTGADLEIMSESSIKRADTNVDNLKDTAAPSQQDLVNQLSLFNSLLMSLGNNNTSSEGESGSQPPSSPAPLSSSGKEEVRPTPDLNDLLQSIGLPTNSSEAAAATPGNPDGTKAQDPTAALQSLALLNSLFGGANGQANPAAAALLGLGAAGSNVATRQTQGNKAQSETEAALAFAELLKQSGALGNGNPGNPNLQNFQNTNANMDAASSNQVAGLLSLLGTLGSLNQPQQQSNSLFNFGQTNGAQPQQQQNNFLNSLLGNTQQPQAQANSLTSLFGAASQQQPQAFNLGNIFGAQQSTPSIPGLGFLSTVGTLGSSLVSTMSSFLGGSGLGGKPRVRGKGVDTRLGLGYRIGDAADAQIVWDIGPQLFTEPIRNEHRPPTIKSKVGHAEPNQHLVSTHARAEKFQQQVAAAKRLLQVQMQNGMTNQQQQFNRRRLMLNQNQQAQLANKFAATHKPLSLLDMWNAAKPTNSFNKPQPQSRSPMTGIPEQLLLPPGTWNRQDTLQMLRRKSFMKRSSPQDLKPFYSKPSDDPLEGHSTLTTYEKMLLKHGSEYGKIDGEFEGDNGGRKPEGNWDKPMMGDQRQEGTEENPRRRPPKPSNTQRRTKNPFRLNPFQKPQGNGRRRPPPQQNNNKRPGGGSRERPFRNREEMNERPQRYRDTLERDDNVDEQEEIGRQEHESERFQDDRPQTSERHTSRERPPSRQDRPQRRKNFGNRAREDNFDHDAEGSEINESMPNKKPSSPLFGFANLFKRLVSPSPPKRKPARPETRRNRHKTRFQGFSDTDDEMEMSESNDRFHARNSARQIEDRPQASRSSFVKKTSSSTESGSKTSAKEGDKSSLSHTTKDAIRMSKTNMHSIEGNPEAEDSFVRRNAVVMNPALLQAEKKKIFHMRQAARPRLPPNHAQQSHPTHLAKSNSNATRRQDSLDTDGTEVDEEVPTQYGSPSLSSTVLSYIKTFLGKKSRNNQTAQSNGNGGIKGGLRGILPNPANLNPLKILPIRRRKPQGPAGGPPGHKTKLVVEDGKPKIVNSTGATEEKDDEPIVHVGEDMPFEELTALFTQNTTQRPKLRRKKVTNKSKPSADSRKDGSLDISFVDKKDVATEADLKDDESEEYDDNDGLKGIFIDIDSGEVNVMKPVAELTSFEPKKESSEEYDEYEDTDGDGIADADMKKKQEIFDQIQNELRRNYEKMKKAHERAEAKKKRKEELVAKGMDESMDVVSKYFDMIDDTDDKDKTKDKKTKTRL